MSDKEQVEEIKILKVEIGVLKKELVENKKNDDKRHKEIKQIQKEHHQDNLKWNKISAIGGVVGTPITLIVYLVTYFINKRPLQKKERNRNKEVEKKLDKLIKLLEIKNNNCLKDQEQKN